MTTTTPTAGTDWMAVGNDWTKTPEQRADLRRYADALCWHDVPYTLPAMQGLAIRATIKSLRLPCVTRVAESADLAPYGFLGIECNYSNGRVRLYLVDTGCEILPLFADHWPN